MAWMLDRECPSGHLDFSLTISTCNSTLFWFVLYSWQCTSHPIRTSSHNREFETTTSNASNEIDFIGTAIVTEFRTRCSRGLSRTHFVKISPATYDDWKPVLFRFEARARGFRIGSRVFLLLDSKSSACQLSRDAAHMGPR